MNGRMIINKGLGSRCLLMGVLIRATIKKTNLTDLDVFRGQMGSTTMGNGWKESGRVQACGGEYRETHTKVSGGRIDPKAMECIHRSRGIPTRDSLKIHSSTEKAYKDSLTEIFSEATTSVAKPRVTDSTIGSTEVTLRGSFRTDLGTAKEYGKEANKRIASIAFARKELTPSKTQQRKGWNRNWESASLIPLRVSKRETAMKDITSKIRSGGRVCSGGPVETSTRVATRLTLEAGTAKCTGKTEAIIKASGSKASNMVRDNFFCQEWATNVVFSRTT